MTRRLTPVFTVASGAAAVAPPPHRSCSPGYPLNNPGPSRPPGTLRPERLKENLAAVNTTRIPSADYSRPP